VTLTRRQVLGLLHDHDVAPSRALGQNFVTDANTVRRIARLARIGAGDRVLEIGAGVGCLTLALAETGAAVTAVEIDRRLVPILRQVTARSGVAVVEADALRVEWSGLLGAGPWTLVANLPYNIATPLVADLLDTVPALRRMLVMVQREVAERLVAGPGDPGYGAVSVKVAYWAQAELVGRVPPSVFVPRPRVESALVALRRRDRPAVDPDLVDADHLFAVVRAGFAQRRKMLRRSLSAFPASAFAAAGVAADRRAEDLDVVDWGRLAAASAGHGGAGQVVRAGLGR
jgi:16S rRNA (adenine1518-N6/adenine1519-N6)-dimethyltransferase